MNQWRWRVLLGFKVHFRWTPTRFLCKRLIDNLHFLFASHLYDNDDMHLPVHSWILFTPFPCRSIVNYGATILRIDQMLCQMRCPSVISVINQSLATPSFLLFLLFSFVNKSKWKCTPVIQTPVERSKKGGIFLDEPVWFGSLLPN